MARQYTSGEEHLTTGKAFRVQRVQGAQRSQFISRLRSMPGASPAGEMSMISEVRPMRQSGRSMRADPQLPNRFEVIRVDPRSIQAYYDYAMDFKDNAAQFSFAIDRITNIYAMIALSLAQKRSLGPVDRMMERSSLAWKIPVRRITGAYYLGWHVQHLGIGIWALRNESREAYFIEFGINHEVTTGKVGPGGMRVRIRRPVMKLAVLEAINIARSSNVGIDQLVSAVMPSGIYQSPMITGSYRPKNPSGSASGLVNLEALEQLAGSGT